MVITTHAGGGNVTGTARGLRGAGAAETEIIAASVDLAGLHMASDQDFNKKSFTTGHTGFSIPFTTWPDRADVPRNAARALRYMHRFVTVTQGEVFYITEVLAALEDLAPIGSRARSELASQLTTRELAPGQGLDQGAALWFVEAGLVERRHERDDGVRWAEPGALSNRPFYRWAGTGVFRRR